MQLVSELFTISFSNFIRVLRESVTSAFKKIDLQHGIRNFGYLKLKINTFDCHYYEFKGLRRVDEKMERLEFCEIRLFECKRIMFFLYTESFPNIS